MTEELNSLISVIQLNMAPDATPGSIIFAVTFTKDMEGESPRLMAASSMLGLI